MTPKFANMAERLMFSAIPIGESLEAQIDAVHEGIQTINRWLGYRIDSPGDDEPENEWRLLDGSRLILEGDTDWCAVDGDGAELYLAGQMAMAQQAALSDVEAAADWRKLSAKIDRMVRR